MVARLISLTKKRDHITPILRDQLHWLPIDQIIQFYGDRAFAVAAPTMWNAVPIHIRNSPTVDQFKAQLKTHLVKAAFLV